MSEPGLALGNTITAREILDKGADTVRNDLVDQPLVQSRLMGIMGEVYTGLGLYDQAEELLQHVYDARDELSDEVALPIAIRLAFVKILKGDHLEAEELIRSSLDSYSEPGNVDDGVADGTPPPGFRAEDAGPAR